MLESLSRSLLHRLDPETAHELSLHGLATLAKTPLRHAISQSVPASPVNLMGIEFPNPVGLAAGFDKNASALDGLAALGFGFIEVGTVTPRPQPGNPRPRLFRLTRDQAIINRMGFNNAGVDAMVRNIQGSRFYRQPNAVLGVNIGKNKDTPNEDALEDYRLCFLKSHELADYVVINISSPNTPDLRELQNDTAFLALLDGMKKVQQEAETASGKYTPLVVKVSPDQSPEQLEFMASAIAGSGFDGVICSNTTIDRPLLQETGLATEAGGLSGQPLLARSNQALAQLRAHLGSDFPLIGCGGVITGDDARSKQEAGADLLQIYTGFVYRGSPLIAECAQAWQKPSATPGPAA
jgi:dihydroorotate dehydrogenase